MIDVEMWAQVRLLSQVKGLSQREIARRTGLNRRTVKRALELDRPPTYGPRAKRSSKLDPYRSAVEELLAEDHSLSAVRIFEEIEALGYDGGMSILRAWLREIRPRFAPLERTHQKTVYRPGELAQIDLVGLRAPVPVGYGQLRRGYLVTLVGNHATLLTSDQRNSSGSLTACP